MAFRRGRAAPIVRKLRKRFIWTGWGPAGVPDRAWTSSSTANGAVTAFRIDQYQPFASDVGEGDVTLMRLRGTFQFSSIATAGPIVIGVRVLPIAAVAAYAAGPASNATADWVLFEEDLNAATGTFGSMRLDSKSRRIVREDECVVMVIENQSGGVINWTVTGRTLFLLGH